MSKVVEESIELSSPVPSLAAEFQKIGALALPLGQLITVN